MMCFIKWLQKTKTAHYVWWDGLTLIVISMLVKSTCNNSKGAVAMMGCIGALAPVPSWWMHHSQLLITFCNCMAMQGHQNKSFSRYRMHAADLGVQHPGDIHSWQQLNEPCGGPGITKLLTTHASQYVTMVEGSFVECQLFLLLKDSLSLPLCSPCHITSRMLQILYFPIGIQNHGPLNQGLKYWILLLDGHPISCMYVHMCMGEL